MAEPLVITSDSVGDTRAALSTGVPVVGWVDVTSPNLVDLLEDLRAEGTLVGLRWSFVSGFANDVCVLRGLRTLSDAGLAVKAEGTVPAAEILARVPGLQLI